MEAAPVDVVAVDVGEGVIVTGFFHEDAVALSLVWDGRGVLEGQVALAFLEELSGYFKPAWGDMWSPGVDVSEDAFVEAELFLVPCKEGH